PGVTRIPGSDAGPRSVTCSRSTARWASGSRATGWRASSRPSGGRWKGRRGIRAAGAGLLGRGRGSRRQPPARGRAGVRGRDESGALRVDGPGHRGTAREGRPRLPLSRRRRPSRVGGCLRDLLLLARPRARRARREAGGPGRLRGAGRLRERSRPVRRGDRSGQRRGPRELPAGVHARRAHPGGRRARAGRGGGAGGGGGTEDPRAGCRIVSLGGAFLWGFVGTVLLTTLMSGA